MYPFYSRIHDSLLSEVKSKKKDIYIERLSKLQTDLAQQKSVNLTQQHTYPPSFFGLLNHPSFSNLKFESLQICIVSVQSSNDMAKGITIDMEIIQKTLHSLGVKHVDTQFIPVPTPQAVISSFPTTSDIIIVIEILR